MRWFFNNILCLQNLEHENVICINCHILGDDASPGNYGMLDQVEALRWIQTNIHGK